MNTSTETKISRSITNETTVFLHQLLRDRDQNDWVVTDLHNHAIELTQIKDDLHGNMEWMDSKVYTPGDIAMYFIPQFESTSDGQEVPVWAY